QDLPGRALPRGQGAEGLLGLLGPDRGADQRGQGVCVLPRPGGGIGEVAGGVGEGAAQGVLLGADGEGGEFERWSAHALHPAAPPTHRAGRPPAVVAEPPLTSMARPAGAPRASALCSGTGPSAGSRTLPPRAATSSRRSAAGSESAIWLMPAIFRASPTLCPMGPPPTTSTFDSGPGAARRTAWTATASGSIRAPRCNGSSGLSSRTLRAGTTR